jgi:hypothetical protein
MMPDGAAMTVEIIREQSDENIVVARVVTSFGTILVMAEVELEDRSLILSGVHVQGDDVKANEIGVSGLRHMIQEAMEELGVDEIVIVGAVRSTGANPGRTPRPLRFTRKVPPQGRPR